MTISTPWRWCSHHHRPEHFASAGTVSCKRIGWYRTEEGALADAEALLHQFADAAAKGIRKDFHLRDDDES